MKLPKSVRVACFDIELEDWHHRSATSEGNMGEFSVIETKIKVDTTANNIVVAAVLQHELLHAICWAYAVNDADKEERIVDVISTALIQVHMDNPKVMEYLDYLLGNVKQVNPPTLDIKQVSTEQLLYELTTRHNMTPCPTKSSFPGDWSLFTIPITADLTADIRIETEALGTLKLLAT